MRRLAIGLACLGGGWVALRTIARHSRRVEGDSMRPTLEPGDLVVVRSRAAPRRGDIVVVRDPRDPSRETVKRIADEPGDVADLPGGPGVVPPDHVAVLGDNPLGSTDSRHYGPIPADAIVGRVRMRLWPRPRPL